MEVELNKGYIESLIDRVHYSTIECATTCYLFVGDAIIEGSSFCFDMSKFNKKMGEDAAYTKAFEKLFELESYHLKRIRK